jgi:preprotein translocase subunit YajC
MFEQFAGVGQQALNFLKWIIIFMPVFLVIIVLVIKKSNTKKYPHKVRIYKVRENGKVKEVNLTGGFIGKKGGTSFFNIKTGFFPWQHKELSETPKMEYVDEEDRVYYKQIDVDTFIQLQRKFENLKDAKGKEIIFTYVPTDVKYGAIMSVEKIRMVLQPQDKWKVIASIGGMVLVFTLAVVLFALMMNSKCPTVG